MKPKTAFKLLFIIAQMIVTVWLVCLSWQDYSDWVVKLIILAIFAMVCAIAFQMHFWEKNDVKNN